MRVVPSACWGSASMSWVVVLPFFVTVDQTDAFPLYAAQRSRLCWGSQGQDILLGDQGEKEMSGKAQIGEFIKRQSAHSKEIFLYWNLLFVGELPLQNTLKHVLGLSRQSCPDIKLCSCSGCVFSKEPWWTLGFRSNLGWSSLVVASPLLWIFFPGVGRAEQSPVQASLSQHWGPCCTWARNHKAPCVSSSALCALTSFLESSWKGKFLVCMMSCFEKERQYILIDCSLLFNKVAVLGVGATHKWQAFGLGYCATWEAETQNQGTGPRSS